MELGVLQDRPFTDSWYSSHHKVTPLSCSKSTDFSRTPTRKSSLAEKTESLVLNKSKSLPKVHFNDRNFLLNLIKSCARDKNIREARRIHTDILNRGLISKDVYLASALIQTYAKCGAMREAREVFEQLLVQDVVSWTILISGYAQHGLGLEALKCFKQMQDEGVSPDAITYLSALKACANIGSLAIAEDLEYEIRKRGLLQKDVMLGASLIDMYAKSGALEKAQEVFDEISLPNVVCWTSLIAGYVQHGLGDEALKQFKQMQDKGVHPNAITYACVLKACSMLKYLEIGEYIDAKARKQGLLKNDIVLSTALIDMYAKCGVLEKAREVFDQLSTRDVVSWSVLITGYAEHGLADEALKCFKQMQDERMQPDAITYICILRACGILGCVEIGKDIDAEIRRQGLLWKEVGLCTTLVDMYAKCGALDKAQEVFNQLQVQDVVSWSALMAGYAQFGQSNMVWVLFAEMRREGIAPNLVTFLVLLSACSHSGLVGNGEKLFDEMHACGLMPKLEHYTCMVDMFSRAGHFEKAKKFLDKVSSSEHLPLLLAILDACHRWVNLELGKWAFGRAIKLNEKCGHAYVCMESIYGAASMQTEAWIAQKRCW